MGGSVIQNKNHLILARTFYRTTTKVMGSGSNLSIWEPQMDSRSLKKMGHIFFVLFDVQSVKLSPKFISSNNFSLNYCFKYDVLYVYISSTMAAILMTSLLGPDAELRWANWLKWLHMTQSLFWYRSPKIVTKFTRDAHST